MPRLYDPLLVMVYANEAVQALLKGDLVNVIVNQNNTRANIPPSSRPLLVSRYVLKRSRESNGGREKKQRLKRLKLLLQVDRRRRLSWRRSLHMPLSGSRRSMTLSRTLWCMSTKVATGNARPRETGRGDHYQISSSYCACCFVCSSVINLMFCDRKCIFKALLKFWPLNCHCR